MAQKDNNIHDRHETPRHDENFDTAPPSPEQSAPTKPSAKSQFSWPGKNTKEQQSVRDAHFKENGVKADLTGGVVPESEQ